MFGTNQQFFLLFAVVASCLDFVAPTRAEDRPHEGIEFFEKKIRPILVDQCYKCHAADSEKGPKGGLLLDTREGLFKGGDTGPAIVPGDPEKSLLIKAVRYADENLQMPPKNRKLSDEQIGDLEAWVKMGAPDPRSKKLETRNSKLETKNHWAFQPIKDPPVPAVKNKRWVQNPVDAFVLSKLEAKGMSPSRQADKRALIRRASYDLTGLPPAPEKVADFLADKSSDAFARVVERLLDSPRYGERWARHWLDVARYADTKGYVFEEERRYAYAYTYRDYVIRALNEDVPFDRFIVEQLAADQLGLGEDKRALAAMGFLTLGRRFLNNQPDIIDDRIDVVTRGLMGLTVTCARCHDHKYDPIPTSDYYSLYGVFASSSEPSDKPLLGTVSLPKGYNEYLAERKKREDELNNFRETKQHEALTQLRQRAGDYLLAAYDTQRLEDKAKAEGLARERKLDPQTVQKWSSKLDEWSKEHHSIFAPWFAFAALPEREFTARSAELAAKYSGNAEAEKAINPLIAEAFAGQAPATMKEVAERYGKLFADADKQWQEMVEAGKKEEKAEPPAALPDPNREALRQVLYAEGAPANLASGEFRRVFDVPTSQKLRALQRKVEELDATHPGAPPKGMVLTDNSQPNKPHIFVRGNPNNPGPEVPRQFLEVVAGPNRKPFEKGSGRFELAQAIASRDNPLTARVIVNRAWLHHFSAGLVRTPSDFGVRSDPPTHPELLDYLAAWFMDNGWSLKKLHRLIMLSAVYQQSSDDNGRVAQVDPDNRLLWKMNRRRLDFESMRDSLLAVSGKLDLTEGGHSVDITTQPFTARRTVYGFVERQNLPGIFRTFDFASPDTTSPQRFATIVPQQALFLMNSPFIVQQARQLATRPEVKACQSSADTVRALYQVAFQRSPERDEVQLGMRFLEAQSRKPAVEPDTPVWQYGHGEFDEPTKRLKEFHPLPHFADAAWQGGPKLPDEKIGWVLLNAAGGHPGRNPAFAAVRRWTAPRDGIVAISGTLKHENEAGDGVRGRVVSSGTGLLGEWTVHNGKESTPLEQIEVKRHETIDFVVDCRENENSDGFSWAPTIRLSAPGAGSHAAVTQQWNAKEEFSGPKDSPKPLDALEKYAQALLVSNELFFVD